MRRFVMTKATCREVARASRRLSRAFEAVEASCTLSASSEGATALLERFPSLTRSEANAVCADMRRLVRDQLLTRRDALGFDPSADRHDPFEVYDALTLACDLSRPRALKRLQGLRTRAEEAMHFVVLIRR
jgi:hypothetical protein